MASSTRAAIRIVRPLERRVAGLHASPLRRPFHSYDHPPPPGPFGPAEEAILAAAYRHVPEHGFSPRALGLGARDAGYLDISPSVLPDGPFSLIRYHLVTQREALAPRAVELFDSEGNERKPGVGAKVATLTWERLMANQPTIRRWQEVSPSTPPRLAPCGPPLYAQLLTEIVQIRHWPSWLSPAMSPTP